MFTVRPYKEEDAAACGDCFYEGFFSCSVDQNDKILLRDYAQILIEKCNFTYVAETEDHQVVGFICGKYDKHFSKALATRYEAKKHYGCWCKMFLKFYLKRYKMNLAANMLLNEDQKIGDIALELGYSNASKFAKAFQSVYGILPKDYRNRNKK